MSFNNVLSPFRAWKHLFNDPVTIADPLNERPASERYRGFHQNDADQCIGCGTCEAICQNGAIDMVEAEGYAAKEGDSGLRPRIDYGRCCWCALCVDICMTGSLSMSNAYTWVERDPDAYRFIPGVDKKGWDEAELGYRRPQGHHLHAPTRIEMGERAPEERIDNFGEIVAGYDVEQARLEADRCVECGLCVATCPAHMSIPQYIKAIREGDYEEGLKLLYETNPFSQVCGRVCTHKCETACAAQHGGDPIAIRWLKRHITDQVPHEKYVELIGKPEPLGRERVKSVAVIGAGPAGLTAAFDLARAGHAVTVYEARKHPGGMPRYGIPEYRLPYDILDADIDVIRQMGVEIICDTRIGDEVTMDQLKESHDAVVLAIGLHLGRSTRIPGSDHGQVYSAVKLLREVTDAGSFEVPEEVVVIGGGNVAMDIARTVGRLQHQQHGMVRVVVTALEAQENFLADPEEIREAVEEGITICPSRGPQACVVEEGQLQSLKTWGVCSIFDEQGRFAPHYDEEDEQCHPAGMIIEAIGQMSDADQLLGEQLTERLEWVRGRLQVCENGRTSEPWLWAAGDCVNGPDVIHAVADGHRVAASINEEFNHA